MDNTKTKRKVEWIWIKVLHSSLMGSVAYLSSSFYEE